MKAPADRGDAGRLPRPLSCMITRSGQPLDVSAARVRLAWMLGVDLIQVRRHDLSINVLECWLRQLCESLPGVRNRLMVNSRWDLALALGAAGVQLREDSIPIAEVRRFLARRSCARERAFIIGASRHTLDGVVDAESQGADFVTLSPVFATDSKPGSEPLGVSMLERACRAVSIPVLALGGVVPARIPRLARDVVGGIAGIGLFDDERLARESVTAFAAWRRTSGSRRPSGGSST